MKLFRGLQRRRTSHGPAETPSGRTPAPAAAEEPGPQTPSAGGPRSLRSLDIGALSDVGRVRPRNEDRFLALQTMTGGGDTQPLPLGLFVVADGMGGQADGDTASEIAVRTIATHTLQELPSLSSSGGSRPIHEILKTAILAAHEAILNQSATPNPSTARRQEAERGSMGTTATVALLIGSAVYMVHVGDTRAYVLDAAGLHALTRDHSLVNRLQELGQLTAEEAKVHPQRSVLYRALGQAEELEVETYYRRLAGVSHLLLCSDGLWNQIPEGEIIQILRTLPGAQVACEALLAAANAAGGEDNSTAVLVALPTAPVSKPR